MNGYRKPFRFWSLIAVSLGLICLSCGGISPDVYHFDRSVDYSASFDRVWTAVIEVLAENSVPVDNLEKASGYVSTREFPVPDEYADSGKTPIGVKLIGVEYGTFNVFVRETTSGSCSIQVNCVYRLATDNIYYRSSVSTGVFEVEFHKALQQKLESPDSHQ